VVYDLLYKEPVTAQTNLSEGERFSRTSQIGLRNCGVINPHNIDNILPVMLFAQAKSLTSITREEVI
jgi:hypothetical protein